MTRLSLHIADDGSILDDEGKILFYSADRFRRDIVDGHCCFICGAPPGSVIFNDEHVIPNWILRRFRLHDKRIVVPGGTELAYGQYKVSCCAACNSRLGDVIEKPVATLFSRGYRALIEHVKAEGPLLLYTWLNLLFLKTHLKDRTLLINRDRRAASGVIAEFYDWPELHHIHCVARIFHTSIAFSPNSLGSLFLFPAKTGSPFGDFDYGDYHPGRALLLRLGEVGIICVLNDACGVLSVLSEDLGKFTAPLAPLQWRELLAHFSYANALLKKRPTFFTHIDKDTEGLVISAEVPDTFERGDFDARQFGEILYSALSSMLDVVRFPEPENKLDLIREGRWTFLFDGDGRFLDVS